MILKTTLLGKTYQFRDLKQVLAKAKAKAAKKAEKTNKEK